MSELSRSLRKRHAAMVGVVGALVALSLLLTTPALCAAATIHFDTFPAGTILTNQLQAQGITFVPYSGAILPLVDVPPSGPVARLDSCAGCGLYPKGARVMFGAVHRTVTAHIGVIGDAGPVRMTAFDASRNSLATQTLAIAAAA